MTQRPAYHLTPDRHWLNDPNGLVHHGGRWHAFFQHNPEGIDWGHMSWGHASSPDLVEWTEHPVALRWTETEEAYSGSAVEDRDGSGSNSGAVAAVAVLGVLALAAAASSDKKDKDHKDHYDDDGYVIQWVRSPIPANSLACLYGLARDVAERRALPVDLDIVPIDETNQRIRPERIADEIARADGGGMACSCGDGAPAGRPSSWSSRPSCGGAGSGRRRSARC